MINDQLLAYVKKQVSLSVPKETIVVNLKASGWSDAEIVEVLQAVIPAVVEPAPVITPASNINSVPVSTISPTTQVPSGVAQTIPPVTNSAVQQPTKSKKLAVFMAVLLFFCLAGGGVGYAYYTGMLISPQKLLTTSMDRMKTVTSLRYDVTADMDFSGMVDLMQELKSIPGIDSTASQLKFEIAGASDFSDQKNIKSSSVVSVSLGNFALGAEIRSINDTIYVMLNKVPGPEVLPFLMLSAFKDKWFSLSQTLRDQIENKPFEASSSDSEDQGSLTTEQKDHLYQMFRDAHVFDTHRLPAETVAGEPSYHFSVDLNHDALLSYFKSSEAYLASINYTSPVLDSASPDEDLKKIKDFHGEIWIGKNDNLVHKVVLNSQVLTDPKKNQPMKVNFTAILSDYNKPVEVTPPANSVPLETLVSEAFGGMVEVE